MQPLQIWNTSSWQPLILFAFVVLGFCRKPSHSMEIRSICCGDGLDPSRPLLGANFSLSGPLHSTSCLSTRNFWIAPITVFRPHFTSQSHVSNVSNVLLLPRNTWWLVNRIALASLCTSCSYSPFGTEVFSRVVQELVSVGILCQSPL